MTPHGPYYKGAEVRGTKSKRHLIFERQVRVSDSQAAALRSTTARQAGASGKKQDERGSLTVHLLLPSSPKPTGTAYLK